MPFENAINFVMDRCIKMSVYSFDTEIAELVGVNAATIYHNMQFWINKNKANNNNYKDGNWWIYNSVKAWQELFPFMTIRAVRTALQKLIDAGLIEKGEYNAKGYDKTTWYAICQNRQMDLSETANGFVNNDKPIPVSNPVSNPSNDCPDEQSHPTELVEKAFHHFWKVWKQTKKDIGKVDTSPKESTLEKKWKPMFNKAYFKTHTIEQFKQEVSDICQFVIDAHNVDGFNRFENMQTGKFFNEKQWRDK